MELALANDRVNDVTSAELEQYTKSHHDTEYVLVDVRQPEEYQQGHIPGAQLFSLSELESHATRLRELEQKTIVFYCRSGGRSARASAWAKGALGLPKVANLLGGFSAYQGIALTKFPRLQAFNQGGSTAAQLLHALDLEKGTFRFYGLLATEFVNSPIAKTIAALAQAEVSHAKSVHELLTRLEPKTEQSFDALFEQLPGKLVESGEALESVVEVARQLGTHGPASLLEIALEIELEAYELYKTLATLAGSTEMRTALDTMAQQEKQHSESILRSLGQLATQ